MSRIPFLFCALGLLALTAARVDAEPKPAPTPLALGARLPAFTATDLAGGPFDLADLAITRERAEAAVRAAAQAFGCVKDAEFTFSIDALSGVQEEGELDPRLKRLMVAEAGKPFGLQVTEAGAAQFKTLKDVADWIMTAQNAPVLFYAWSPRCPTSRTLNDRIVETLAASGIRSFALACNYNDTREQIDAFVDEFDFRGRILMDSDQRITDVLGGKRTPHFFLLDAGMVLRYRGGLDDDPAGMKEAADRLHWLKDAADAIKAGKEVPAADTEPAG